MKPVGKVGRAHSATKAVGVASSLETLSDYYMSLYN